jgi:molybdopterin-guanine dinucleotide biosynthesis protein A
MTASTPHATPTPLESWTAAILAGGQATRLNGRNKAALRLGHAAVLERQLSVLSMVVGQTIIIASDEAPYRSYDVPIIPDLMPGTGALGAVYSAIQMIRNARTLVVACDMPFLTVPFLSHLVEAGRDVDIAIPRTARGYEPLCATYSWRCATLLRRQIDAKHLKVSDVLAGAQELTIRELGPDEIAQYGREELLFFNINTPDDYARAIDLEAESRGERPLPG